MSDRSILELRARASEILQRVEDETAANLAGVIQAVRDQLIAWLEAHPDAGIADMFEVLSILIDQGAQASADFMVTMGDAVIDTALAVQQTVADQLGITTTNELQAAVATWNDQFKLDLLTEGHQQWYSRIKAETLNPGGALRSSLEAANVWGEDMNAAVDLLIARDPDFSSFPPLDIDPIARARMIVRTESTRFDNAVSVSLSESIGIDQFVNVGVGDERQSDICQGATEQGPMTIDEWKSSEWGAAPRHPNCRCALVGVGPEFDPSDAMKRNAGVLN